MMCNVNTTNLSGTQITLMNYLRQHVAAGQKYFKARYITADTGMPSRLVGRNLSIVAKVCDDLNIVKYSRANGSTWLITPK